MRKETVKEEYLVNCWIHSFIHLIKIYSRCHAR